MSATQQASLSRPQSDVSAAVGLVGLAGLFAWVAFARAFPWLAERFDWPVPYDTLGGPNAALVGLLLDDVLIAQKRQRRVNIVFPLAPHIV